MADGIAAPDRVRPAVGSPRRGSAAPGSLPADGRLRPRGQKRDEHLLEEVFRLSCRYVGQSPSQSIYLDEVRRAMHANVGWQRILNYLKFLDGTLLMRLVAPPRRASI